MRSLVSLCQCVFLRFSFDSLSSVFMLSYYYVLDDCLLFNERVGGEVEVIWEALGEGKL